MTIKKIIVAMLISTASFTGASLALAANDAKATYKAVEDAAEATYKADLAKCDGLSGNGKDVCVEQAKATREHATQDAKAAYKKTPKALASARKEEAEADYAVAREKCNALAGNVKDVCVKKAKADEANAVTDARAKQEMSQSKAAVRDERAEERYKVALAKCDSLAGPSKEACVTAAESERGQ
ncbi:hypothetical protein CAter282_3444 [Collimonas arenae]|uniref:Cell envelope biogenesis protein TolA n=1 Tax=Collimonas arenae TaxID=279058 RepID=A0A127QM53_9BURK|nr:hypothetical protein [Collimonas arenae]AMP01236.1 hypothetical protein CAter10_3773 [Collimonas arenae]AMP11133.1 hypothetical protein CAter282_3444 [Collimonas arenae]